MTKLVIVDDHEALRDGLAALLALRGFDVVGTAGNVAAGSDLMTVAEPDVALIDAELPDGDGIALARALLALRPALGVVLYSDDADPELLHACLDAGIRGYALKAGSAEELEGALAAVAGGDTYVDPRLHRNAAPVEAVDEAPRLSPREREVMQAMAEGYTAERVGEMLGLSVETIRTHVRNAVRKLQARNRVHAIAIALGRGEIALEGGRE